MKYFHNKNCSLSYYRIYIIPNITDNLHRIIFYSSVNTAKLEPALVPYYEKGMTNYSQQDAKKLIEEAAEKENLAPVIIHVCNTFIIKRTRI